jgi:hypothetical protein
MGEYRREWSQYRVLTLHRQAQTEKGEKDEKDEPAPTPPVRPDFEKLAKENGLSTDHSPLLPQWDVKALPVGSSLIDRRDPVWHAMFTESPLFRGEVAMSLGGHFYLVWKTDEQKDTVPSFDDKGVRERVLESWKMVHARPLAMKAAEAMAQEVRESKRALKESLAKRPGTHVIAPPPFSWITFGNVPLGSAPEAARISEVPGVEYPGDDFMRMVFGLDSGQCGVALNGPQTMAYVVQVSDFSPSQTVLQKVFEVDDFSKYAPAAMDDKRQMIQAWIKEIKTSADFEWKRKPSQTAMGGAMDD